MAIYYPSEMHAGKMHDRMEKYLVEFACGSLANVKAKHTITLFIEEGDEDWTKITKKLGKRYTKPYILSVKRL